MAKYTIRYRGCDGSETFRFSSLGAVARYVKARDLGSCYRRPEGLQGEYAFFSFDGFGWSDLLDKSPYAEDAKYKPEVVNDVKLSFRETKLKAPKGGNIYDELRFNRSPDRLWVVKDGPETVGEIRRKGGDEAAPFKTVYGDMGSLRKDGPDAATLDAAKKWFVEKYTEEVRVPVPEPAPSVPEGWVHYPGED